MKGIRGQRLKEFNTFGIDASCDLLFKIESVKDLKKVVDKNPPPYFILGGGSNLLISQDQHTTFLKNEIKGKKIVQETDDHVLVKVGGGENWHEFVLWAIDNNYGGIENLSLIPGTVGASPIQNIGAYGVELDQVFHELKAVNIDLRKSRKFSREECEFGYRNSIFKNELKGQFFISHVTFKLTKKNHKINISYAPLAARFDKTPSIKEVSEAVIDIRQSKLPDPAIIGNSGSFFKNPIVENAVLERIEKLYPEVPHYPVDQNLVKIPAGWLIEKAGWKGYRKGDAGVYEKQALVLVNHGEATGPEIWALAQEIIADIANKFSINLQAEVNII